MYRVMYKDAHHTWPIEMVSSIGARRSPLNDNFEQSTKPHSECFSAQTPLEGSQVSRAKKEGRWHI